MASNQIATIADTNGFGIHTLDEAIRYSQAMADAGIVPDAFKRNPPNILVAQEIAKALNESTWVVMSEMSIISGKPSFSAKFMRSRVRQAGHKLRETYDKDTGIARAVIIRSDDPEFEHVAEWDRAKAEAHGLWGKGHWKKNDVLMLKNRALSEVVREACYEVMGGVAYTPDEVQDFAPVRQTAHRQDTPPAPSQAPTQHHVMAQLDATPVDGHSIDEWAEKIANATTVDDLMHMYPEASTNPEWDTAIKPLFTTRKEQIEQDTHEPVEAELMPESA